VKLMRLPLVPMIVDSKGHPFESPLVACSRSDITEVANLDESFHMSLNTPRRVGRTKSARASFQNRPRVFNVGNSISAYSRKAS
jgi:hypothetical protein